jgi:hypothetical protein
LEAILAKEKGALSEEEDGKDVRDPPDATSKEGDVCHECDRRGEKVPLKPLFMVEENAVEEEAEVGGEL